MNLLLLSHELLVLALGLGLLLVDLWLPVPAKRKLGYVAAAGVGLLRISPQARHTERIVRLFRALMDGELAAADAPARLAPLMPNQPCDGYWLGEAGTARTKKPRSRGRSPSQPCPKASPLPACRAT